MRGKMVEAGAMLLRVAVGTAECGDRKYELAQSVNGAPLIRSEQTGKTFALAWDDLIALAIEAGVDDGEVESDA